MPNSPSTQVGWQRRPPPGKRECWRRGDLATAGPLGEEPYSQKRWRGGGAASFDETAVTGRGGTETKVAQRHEASKADRPENRWEWSPRRRHVRLCDQRPQCKVGNR